MCQWQRGQRSYIMSYWHIGGPPYINIIDVLFYDLIVGIIVTCYMMATCEVDVHTLQAYVFLAGLCNFCFSRLL